MGNLASDQFVALDRGVAARYQDLIARASITTYDYNSWMRDYRQLENFAMANSGDKRVARGWAEEQPRYANASRFLQARISDRPAFNYTPSLYDTRVRVANSDCCGSDCGSNQLAAPPLTSYTPGAAPIFPNRGGTTIFGGDTVTTSPSLGDLLKGLLGMGKEVPSIDTPYPDSPLLNQVDIFSGIITALIVGGILWFIHKATKKNA